MTLTPMLRTFLIVVPFTVISVAIACLIMIPVTWILRDIRPIYAVARVVVGMIMRLAGIRVETSGADPWTAPQPCVYVANHISNIDPPMLFLFLPRIAMLGKASVFRLPLLGHALKLGEFIPVERGQINSRRRALEAGIDRLRRGVSLLVFPEGTRSPDGTLLPFRPGSFTMAIEAQAPIVPVTILGARDVMPKGQNWIRPGKVQLVFHPPIPTIGLRQEDREELMKRVRDVIEGALPVACA